MYMYRKQHEIPLKMIKEFASGKGVRDRNWKLLKEKLGLVLNDWMFCKKKAFVYYCKLIFKIHHSTWKGTWPSTDWTFRRVPHEKTSPSLLTMLSCLPPVQLWGILEGSICRVVSLYIYLSRCTCCLTLGHWLWLVNNFCLHTVTCRPPDQSWVNTHHQW